MASGESFWRDLRRSVRKAEKELRGGEPEGVHDLRVALRRAAVVADSSGRARTAKLAEGLVDRLSAARRLEVDRQLLGALKSDGTVGPVAADAVDALLAERLRKGFRKAGDAIDGKPFRRLEKKLGKREKKPARLAQRLTRKSTDSAAPKLDPGAGDRALHRARLAMKRRRYLLMARRDLGAVGLEGEIDGARALQDALGVSNDWRTFADDLDRIRKKAESPDDRAAVDAVRSVVASQQAATRRGAISAVLAATRSKRLVGKSAGSKRAGNHSSARAEPAARSGGGEPAASSSAPPKA